LPSPEIKKEYDRLKKDPSILANELKKEIDEKQKKFLKDLEIALKTKKNLTKEQMDYVKERSKNSFTGSKNPTPNPINNIVQKILDYARSQKKVKYVMGGQSPKSSSTPPVKGTSNPGFDCSGFVRWVFKTSGNFNKEDGTLDTKIYNSFPGHAPGQESKVKKINRPELKEGDLVFFTMPGFSKAGHVGVVTKVYPSNFDMIHASSSAGIVEDSNVQSNSYWKPKIRSYGRWENPNIS